MLLDRKNIHVYSLNKRSVFSNFCSGLNFRREGGGGKIFMDFECERRWREENFEFLDSLER
jgi:hypothetical protein